MNNLPARTGWDWLKQGTVLFRKQPAALTTILFASILCSIGLSVLPLVGTVLSPLLIPSFSMAFMQACLMIENGDRVTPGVLLTGFRRPVLGALCKVGSIYLVVGLVEMLVVVLALGPEFFEKIARRQADPNAAAQSLSSEMVVFMLIALLNMVMLITLYFAAPLTYWKQMGTGKAVFYSFFAVVRSARVFLVLVLAWFGAFFLLASIATILFGQGTVGRVLLAWLVFLFMLLLQCAMYAGYRTIFGKPSSDKGMQPA
jgi:hypothetical protein